MAATDESERKSTIREYYEALLIAFIFVNFARIFVFQAFKIPSGSMEDNLLIGDHIIVNKFIYGPGGALMEKLMPLRDVHRVPAPADPGIPGRRGLREESRHVLGEGVLHSLGEPLLRELHACEENPRNFDREIVAAAQVCRWTARHDPPRFPLARCSS